ncbi:MAG TPA: DUF1566 domain-containing protein [Bacteroidota bacterium]|nr:DUF1566 domain-containing protein [Bacteroidota bacterium]
MNQVLLTNLTGRCFVKHKNFIGWTAVSISTLFASLWAFWGAIENFHEGWYFESFWENVALMFVQYVPWSLGFVVLGIVSLRWPRIGGSIFILIGILLPTLLIRTFAAVFFIALPLGTVGLLFWFGQPEPGIWAYRTVVGVPLAVLIGFSIEPAYRVSGRVDDGHYGARIIEGNGVTLLWAPEGPGWPAHWSQFKAGTWDSAMKVCRYLTEDGTALADTAVNFWRLPTVDEAVRSLVRHGTNAGGTWEPSSREPSYEVIPDKESPLWKVHSPMIYWWTSTEVNDSVAYRIAYNGGVHAMPKKIRMGDFGFRAVRTVTPSPPEVGVR